MSIYDNAIGSIVVGVEDFESGDANRLLSAVRSIMSGILLLYKEKLYRLSPDHDKQALLKSKLVPMKLENGMISVVGRGKSTVNYHQIKERFRELEVHVDWKRLDRMRDLRNDVEHLYTSLTKAMVKEILANSFVLIRDFLANELDEDPLETLGEKCWSVLLDVSDVYDSEYLQCKNILDAIDWKYDTMESCVSYFRCYKCHSALIRSNESEYSLQMELLCSSCGSAFVVSKIIESCVDELLGGEAYVAAKESCEPPYERCPACGKETYIISESICIACEEVLDYTNCSMCDASLTVDEQLLDGYCGYCNHRIEKLRDE